MATTALSARPVVDGSAALSLLTEPPAAPSAPSAVAEVVGVLRGTATLLSRLEPAAMPAAVRRDVLAELERVSGALTAARGRVLAAAERAQDWRSSGDRSAAAWHGRTSRVGQAQARTHVRQARAMEQMPTVARAVESGEVTTAHLDALARAAEQATGAAREVLETPAVQAELVGIARRQDPEAFARTVRRRLAAHDPDELDRSYAAQRAERYLFLSTTPMGVRLQGQVDPVAGQALRQALEALSPRPAEGDDRSPEQRRADALATMAEAVLKDPGTTSGSAVRPHVSLVMTDESLAAHRQLYAARARGARQTDEARVPDEPAVPFSPATFEDGTPVPPDVVARVLCDYEITRVALDAEGMPVDVGRTKRCYDGHLRRAVIVRDGTCSWPGCTHHARWCEIHHMTWWSRGGGTSLENGVLLCTFHHHRVHELDLRISRHALRRGEITRDGLARVRYEFRRADGRMFEPDGGRGSPYPSSAGTSTRGTARIAGGAGPPGSTGSAPPGPTGSAPPGSTGPAQPGATGSDPPGQPLLLATRSSA